MSPEQLQGINLDRRSDIFSLGIVIYEILTGEKAFSGESYSTIAYKIMNESPPPPSKINSLLPEGLDRIILKALSKNPKDRYSSCIELANDIERQTKIASFETISDSKERHHRENRQFKLISILALIILFLAGIYMFFPFKERISNYFLSHNGLWIEECTGMEFVWVPGGYFMVGCDDWMVDCYDNEKPVHKVGIKGFWLGKFEVTQEQWEKVMGYNPSLFKLGKNYPLERVSWNDIQDFFKRLYFLSKNRYSFRLPTEYEWEYAARSGGKKQVFSGGEQINFVAWYEGNSKGTTHQVGTRSPNSLGLYDMNGNVMEWCDDVYIEYTDRLKSFNDYASKNDKVVRGGSWADSSVDARNTYRTHFPPAARIVRLGFRVLMEP